MTVWVLSAKSRAICSRGSGFLAGAFPREERGRTPSQQYLSEDGLLGSPDCDIRKNEQQLSPPKHSSVSTRQDTRYRHVCKYALSWKRGGTYSVGDDDAAADDDDYDGR